MQQNNKAALALARGSFVVIIIIIIIIFGYIPSRCRVSEPVAAHRWLVGWLAAGWRCIFPNILFLVPLVLLVLLVLLLLVVVVLVSRLLLVLFIIIV